MESTDGNEVVIDYRQRNHPIKVVKVGKTLTVKAKGQDILKTRNAYLLDEEEFNRWQAHARSTLRSAYIDKSSGDEISEFSH